MDMQDLDPVTYELIAAIDDEIRAAFRKAVDAQLIDRQMYDKAIAYIADLYYEKNELIAKAKTQTSQHSPR